MQQSKALKGILIYEFKMQIRRRSLWIAFIGCTLLLARTLFNEVSNPQYFGLVKNLPIHQFVVTMIFTTSLLLPIIFGVFLADRLPRDSQTNVNELFTSMPVALNTRIVGKYLGSALASLVPMFICYSLLIGFLLYETHNARIIPLFLLDFVLVVLPGLLFVAAFSIACPAIIWVPLYQFLFIGYWFWGNVLSPRNGIPTLSSTILTPIGIYISTGILGISQVPWVPNATLMEGMASLATKSTIIEI
jgi:ABC-2 type transport system permease protein